MNDLLERVVRLETMNSEHEKTLNNLRADYHEDLKRHIEHETTIFNNLNTDMKKIVEKVSAIEKQTSGYRMMVVGGIAVFGMMIGAINWLMGVLNLDISNLLNKIK